MGPVTLPDREPALGQRCDYVERRLCVFVDNNAPKIPQSRSPSFLDVKIWGPCAWTQCCLNALRQVQVGASVAGEIGASKRSGATVGDTHVFSEWGEHRDFAWLSSVQVGVFWGQFGGTVSFDFVEWYAAWSLAAANLVCGVWSRCLVLGILLGFGLAMANRIISVITVS